MIDRNHPAVKAGAQQLSDYENDGQTYPPIELHYEAAQVALEAAWPELTTATEDNLARLRNTPAGKQLMAEVYQHAADVAIAHADNGAAQLIIRAAVRRTSGKADQ